MSRLSYAANWALGACVLLLAWFAYRPGLSGGFHFDDFANLPILGAMGAIDSFDAFMRYVTAGHADPTGRPIALLSFLLDARDWPAEPRHFLRTNILLHLTNGALLAWLLMQIQAQRLVTVAAGESAARIAAIVAASLWLLHPLFVSTTLYVVQREAMLPATFILSGLLTWLHGRQLMRAGNYSSGLVWIIVGLVCFTGLAVLSKANGALLPALALVIDATALRGTAPPTPIYKRAMRVFAWLPTLLVGSYLVYVAWLGFTQGVSDTRPWTLYERLLTQPRVLVDYLSLLWLPRPFTSGLFNDQFTASTSLLSPATTLAALVLVSILIAGAWATRRRRPLLALAILFFFVGHAIESTTIALELYFEHRNYVPSMLMFWPLATWLCAVTTITEDAVKVPPTLRHALALLLVAGLGSMTYLRAELWGNTHDQALLWAQLNPTSARAQAHAAHFETTHGRADRAVKRLSTTLATRPDDVQLALGLISAECASGELSEKTLYKTVNALSSTREVGGLLTSWFVRAIEIGVSSCPKLDLKALEHLVHAAQRNPYLSGRPARRQDLLHLHGRLALARNQPKIALAYFDRALVEQVRIGFALEQAALLGASGQPALGLKHLEAFESAKASEFRPAAGMPRLHAWILRRQGYWSNEFARLRQTLRQDVLADARKLK